MIQKNNFTPNSIKTYIDTYLLRMSPTGDLFSSYQLFENKSLPFSTEEITKDVKLNVNLILKVKEQLYFRLQLNLGENIVYETPYLSFEEVETAEEAMELFYQEYLSFKEKPERKPISKLSGIFANSFVKTESRFGKFDPRQAIK